MVLGDSTNLNLMFEIEGLNPSITLETIRETERSTTKEDLTYTAILQSITSYPYIHV